jgi:hypothetical protein
VVVCVYWGADAGPALGTPRQDRSLVAKTMVCSHYILCLCLKH